MQWNLFNFWGLRSDENETSRYRIVTLTSTNIQIMGIREVITKDKFPRCSLQTLSTNSMTKHMENNEDNIDIDIDHRQTMNCLVDET